MKEYIEKLTMRECCIDEDGHTDEPIIKKLNEVIDFINFSDVAPVRHGSWEWFEDWNPSTTDHPAECDDCGWRCSECKTALEDAFGGYWDNPFVKPKLNYCNQCGAKMDGGEPNAFTLD